MKKEIERFPNGRKVPKYLSSDEMTTILVLSQQGVSRNEISRKLGRNISVISRTLSRLQDTTILADATIKAGAVKLAKRVVSKAGVKESIDVLSRPNIGVLAPATKDSNSGPAIEVSVGIQSCGTVVAAKVAVNGPQDQKVLPQQGRSQGALPVSKAASKGSVFAESSRVNSGILDSGGDEETESRG